MSTFDLHNALESVTGQCLDIDDIDREQADELLARLEAYLAEPVEPEYAFEVGDAAIVVPSDNPWGSAFPPGTAVRIVSRFASERGPAYEVRATRYSFSQTVTEGDIAASVTVAEVEPF